MGATPADRQSEYERSVRESFGLYELKHGIAWFYLMHDSQLSPRMREHCKEAVAEFAGESPTSTYILAYKGRMQTGADDLPDMVAALKPGQVFAWTRQCAQMPL